MFGQAMEDVGIMCSGDFVGAFLAETKFIGFMFSLKSPRFCAMLSLFMKHQKGKI